MDVRVGNCFRVKPFEFIPPRHPALGGDRLGISQAVRPDALDHIGGLDLEVEAAGGHGFTAAFT